MADKNFHADDLECLQRMLGAVEPQRCHPDLLTRYHRQLRFLHAGQGRGGPLGAAPLAALLDSLQLKPAAEIREEQQPKRVDWNEVKPGQPIIAQLPDRKQARKGVYAGRLPEGLLIIQFLDAGVGELIEPRYVTLFDEIPAGIDPDGFSERAVDDMDPDFEDEGLSESELDAMETRTAPPTQTAEGELDEELPGPSAFAKRWSRLPVGTACHVKYDDDIQDMEYVGIYDEGDTKLVFRDKKTDDVVVVDAADVTVADELAAAAVQELDDVDDDL